MDFTIDLHVHTNRYSQCAEFLDPYQIEAEALARGVDGVVITDHDVLWHEEEVEMLRQRVTSISIYRGIEVSAAGCHLVIIGVDDAARLVPGDSPESVAGLAHSAGAVVILAHPYRDADPRTIAPTTVDAIEVGSTSFTAQEAAKARALAKELDRPVVASSDAHALSRIGWAYTRFPRQPKDELDLAAMIREGCGVPVLPNPFPGQ